MSREWTEVRTVAETAVIEVKGPKRPTNVRIGKESDVDELIHRLRSIKKALQSMSIEKKRETIQNAVITPR